MAQPRYVDIELGFDRVEAVLIAEQCKAEGLAVALRLMDDDGQASPLLSSQAHRLSTAENDLEAVRAIVEAARAPIFHTSVRDRSWFAWGFGVAMLVMVVGAVVIGLIQSLL